MRYFHGSDDVISMFDLSFVGNGTDQYGSGIYFTSDPEDASRYTSKDGGNVTPVYLDLKNPICIVEEDEGARTQQKPLTLRQVKAMIINAPDYTETLWNFGDIGSEGVASVLQKAIHLYANGYEDPIKQINSIGNDFYRGEEKLMLENLIRYSDYDGVVVSKYGGITHAIVWNPQEQIKYAYEKKAQPLYSQELQIKAKGVRP